MRDIVHTVLCDAIFGGEKGYGFAPSAGQRSVMERSQQYRKVGGQISVPATEIISVCLSGPVLVASRSTALAGNAPISGISVRSFARNAFAKPAANGFCSKAAMSDPYVDPR